MYEYRANVTGVYDGDSITVDIDLGFNIWMKEQKIRLAEIDTPELRGEERPEGLIARDILREWILDKGVILKTDKDRSGKYGRWIATVFLPTLNEETNTEELININQKLLDRGYADPYI